MPIENNVVLCASKFERRSHVVFLPYNKPTKGHKETLGGIGYIYCLMVTIIYYCDDIMGICIRPNSSNCTYYVQFFVYQVYVNKAVKKKSVSGYIYMVPAKRE